MYLISNRPTYHSYISRVQWHPSIRLDIIAKSQICQWIFPWHSHSGELTKSNWTWPSRNSGFSHEKWVDLSIAKCNSSPEGKHPWHSHEKSMDLPRSQDVGRVTWRPGFCSSSAFSPCVEGGKIPEKIWVEPPIFRGKSKEHHRKNDHFHWNLIGVSWNNGTSSINKDIIGDIVGYSWNSDVNGILMEYVTNLIRYFIPENHWWTHRLPLG